MSKEEKNIDAVFKAAFDDFEVKPPSHNGNEAVKGMDTQIDEKFRDQLSPLAVTPKPHVWEKIKEELPLHPGVHRYISWMTKIAAILVIGMLLTIFSDRQQKEEMAFQEIQPELLIPPSTHFDYAQNEEVPGEFVFEVKNKHIVSNHPRKYNSEEEEEIKNLLLSILEEDDFADNVDQEVIEKSMEIATGLLEGIALVIPENDDVPEPTPDIKFDVKIPLIIVENEEEAAQLIRFYDSSHQPQKQTVEIH